MEQRCTKKKKKHQVNSTLICYFFLLYSTWNAYEKYRFCISNAKKNAKNIKTILNLWINWKYFYFYISVRLSVRMYVSCPSICLFVYPTVWNFLIKWWIFVQKDCLPAILLAVLHSLVRPQIIMSSDSPKIYMGEYFVEFQKSYKYWIQNKSLRIMGEV